MQLPAELRAALEDLTQDTEGLRAAAGAVSERYRGREASLQVRNAAESRAYLATRLPATYAAAWRSMQILQKALPDFTPARMLDIGAGPGTVALAARAFWTPSMTLLEPNDHLREAGQALGKSLSLQAEWLSSTIDRAEIPGKYELVTAGYVFNELPEGDLDKNLLKLWSATDDVLLLIEPGTPQGSAVIQRARDLILRHGGHIVAPCPQEGVCPLKNLTDRWCHFSIRVDRSRLHRQMKNAELSYEDEKFSFIAFARKAVDLPRCRILGHPVGAKVLRLQVCDSAGKALTLDIPKSDPRHKALRRLEWGDSFM